MASFAGQTKVLRCRYDTKRIRMAFATTPALDADDVVTFTQDSQFDGLEDTPLQTAINILLPIGLVEVRLLLREQEGINPTIEMRILSGSG